jgi:hypothetical protein
MHIRHPSEASKASEGAQHRLAAREWSKSEWQPARHIPTHAGGECEEARKCATEQAQLGDEQAGGEHGGELV